MIRLGSSVLIAGFGREGQSTLRFLNQHYPSLKIALADQNPAPLANQPYPTFSGPGYLDHLADFDTVIRSPGIPPSNLTSAHAVTTAVNLFFDRCKAPVIGVTGTKGKSTTASLIHHLLKSAGKTTVLVGNIGAPALNFLDQITPDTQVVMELSSYQIEDLLFSPHIAVILPISQEHLNYHGSYQAYVQAKKNLVTHQTASDYVIYHAGNPDAAAIAQSSKAQALAYTHTQFRLPSKLPLLGQANRDNILAAVTVTRLLGVTDVKLIAALPDFKPLPHRLEPVGTYHGITFYNDSLATTPVSTFHALEALGNKVSTLIAGGFDRGLDYTALGQALAQSRLSTLILLPDTGTKLKQAVIEAKPNSTLNIVSVPDLDHAVAQAFKLTPKNKICLLSPAATSFNQFKDYADRGDTFKRLVRSHSPK